MRAFRCLVDIETKKDETTVTKETQIWIVKAEDQNGAGKKIYRHFREYNLFKKGRDIAAIHYTEIQLSGAMDLEEYLESKEDATVCVLF